MAGFGFDRTNSVRTRAHIYGEQFSRISITGQFFWVDCLGQNVNLLVRTDRVRRDLLRVKTDQP